MLRETIAIWLVLQTVWCSSMDDSPSIINEAEQDSIDKNLNRIVPGYLPKVHKTLKPLDKYEDILKDNVSYKKLKANLKDGMNMKELTFNIYDDAMRNYVIILLDFIKNLDAEEYDYRTILDKLEINEDLVSYASDINMLYRDSSIGEATFKPPFLNKPNYFVNSEVIFQALKLTRQKYFEFLQSNNSDILDFDNIVINTNYSGWNLLGNGGDEEVNYFREDISLNSYYYGIHLMHPYWMKNDELDEVNPRHYEYYYYHHQQLQARYLLEKEFLRQGNLSASAEDRYSDFNPYLVHDNGLPFPVRSNVAGDWSEDKAKIKAIDIAIKECISRRKIIMGNSTTIYINEENYVDVLSKLIRANYESLKTAKIIRSLFGYGGNGYPYDVYNPSPSVLHYAETSLRDPVYWYLMKYALDYFTEFEKSLEPWDISEYETEDIHIHEAIIPKITTFFDYYQFTINKALSKNNNLFSNLPVTITARQKRLKHSKPTFCFAVSARKADNFVIRLFIGPPCANHCWNHYSKFFEVDKFEHHLHEGINFIKWSPGNSSKFSSDDFYNMEETDNEEFSNSGKYNMFKFPDNLVIPRGLDNGLNLTLFIMIVPVQELIEPTTANNVYTSLVHEIDNKPLGFPFHRLAVGFNPVAKNYKFYKITIYHERNNVVKNDSFSKNLS